MKRILTICAFLIVSLCFVISTAQAATMELDTSGIWTNAVEQPSAVVTGEDTSHIEWGTPSGTGPNSLTFTGETDLSVETDEIFAFGEIEYYNGSTLVGTGIDAVDLETTVTAALPATGQSVDLMTFNVYATPNTGTPEQNADTITFSGAINNAVFELDGTTYLLEFMGFGSLDANGFVSEINTFHVLEGYSASAQAFGRITAAPIPELDPASGSSALVLLLGSAVVFKGRRRA